MVLLTVVSSLCMSVQFLQTQKPTIKVQIEKNRDFALHCLTLSICQKTISTYSDAAWGTRCTFCVSFPIWSPEVISSVKSRMRMKSWNTLMWLLMGIAHRLVEGIKVIICGVAVPKSYFLYVRIFAQETQVYDLFRNNL